MERVHGCLPEIRADPHELMQRSGRTLTTDGSERGPGLSIALDADGFCSHCILRLLANLLTTNNEARMITTTATAMMLLVEGPAPSGMDAGG
jgi:hypothetical protein